MTACVKTPEQRFLVEEFCENASEMPAALVEEIGRPYRRWEFSFDAAERKVKIAALWTPFTDRCSPAMASKVLFSHAYTVDGVYGEEWFLSWLHRPTINVSNVEELL